jgi:hypothetical protein
MFILEQFWHGFPPWQRTFLFRHVKQPAGAVSISGGLKEEDQREEQGRTVECSFQLLSHGVAWERNSSTYTK